MLSVLSRGEKDKRGQKAGRNTVAGDLEAPVPGRNTLTIVTDPTNVYSVLTVCKSCLYALSPSFPGKVEAPSDVFTVSARGQEIILDILNRDTLVQGIGYTGDDRAKKPKVGQCKVLEMKSRKLLPLPEA